MKSSDSLFQLIKSLSPAEKRYFKMNAALMGPSENKNYIKLFTAIETLSRKSSDYDEKKLIQKLGTESFVTRIAFEKNHLFNLILISLQSFHANTSISNELKNEQQKIELLYNKALFHEALKRIKKAKDLAYKFEKFTDVLELIEWGKKIERHIEQITEAQNPDMLTPIMEESMVLELITNQHYFKKESRKLFELLKKKGPARNKKEFAAYKNLIRDFANTPETKPSTFISTILYHHTKTLFHFATGNLKNLEKEFQFMITYMENKSWLTGQEIHLYITGVTNSLIHLLDTQQFSTVEKSVEKLLTIENRFDITLSQATKLKLQLSHFQFLFPSYIEKGDFQKGVDHIDYSNNYLQQHKEKISITQLKEFYYHFAYLCYGVGDYKKTLRWLGMLINEKDSDFLQDLQCYARILKLITLTELQGDADLAGNIRSLYRYLKKRDKIYKLEEELILFFRELKNNDGPNEIKKRFQKLRSNFKKLQENPLEARAFRNFDLISWLDSKIEGKSFEEVKKRNAS